MLKQKKLLKNKGNFEANNSNSFAFYNQQVARKMELDNTM